MIVSPKDQLKGAVLIVEDERDLAAILAMHIQRLGMKTLMASSGEEALECLKYKDVSLVLSDISMPGMSGLKLLARAQALDLRAPFVFLTAYGSTEIVVEAVRLGAVDFLRKPYEEAELQAVLRRGLAIAERMQSIDELIAELGEGVAPRSSILLQDLRRQIGLLRMMGHDEKVRLKAG